MLWFRGCNCRLGTEESESDCARTSRPLSLSDELDEGRVHSVCGSVGEAECGLHGGACKGC